jgi:hypothetical protein
MPASLPRRNYTTDYSLLSPSQTEILLSFEPELALDAVETIMAPAFHFPMVKKIIIYHA